MYSMKLVLLVDGSPMFRDYLNDKLSVEQISLENSVVREAFKKMNNLMPALILIEIADSLTEEQVYFLKKKSEDPNGKRIPLMVIGNPARRNKITALLEFGITKYFSKPLRFALFFKSLGKYLNITFSLDTTPSFFELHRNGSLIFIEAARQINREQVTLLKYQISRIIAARKISVPRVILMLSGMNLSFIDGINLEFLIDNISAGGRVPNKFIKILTFDKYVDAFIAGHAAYTGIQTANNIQHLLTFAEAQGSPGAPVQDLIIDKIINAPDPSAARLDFIELGDFIKTEEASPPRIAIVDNDVNVQNALGAAVFSAAGSRADVFSSAIAFIDASLSEEYDVVITELFLPDIDGISMLRNLRARNVLCPFIIYSTAPNQGIVSQAFSLGAKAFLLKPQSPEVIMNKVFEVLRSGRRREGRPSPYAKD